VNFDLAPEHELLRDTVRQFALDRVAPLAEELDREKRFPYELVPEARRAGPDG
jgi:alkylation response protein AidB-like acyl-CoA dehydrogenase